MHIQKLTLTAFLLICFSITYGQQGFKVVVKDTGGWQEIFSLVDENRKHIRNLDTAKYFVCFNSGKNVYFAIFGMRSGYSEGYGWPAIDADEKILFNVYNTSFGEPNPDYLVEKKIRIVDNNNLIGFADHRGKVIIKPQFEFVTSFHNGKAIIAKACKKVPVGDHANKNDCKHYSIVCEQYGFINTHGTVLKLGNYTFEEIMKEIHWKMPEDYFTRSESQIK